MLPQVLLYMLPLALTAAIAQSSEPTADYQLPDEFKLKKFNVILDKSEARDLSCLARTSARTVYLRLYSENPDGTWRTQHKTHSISFNLTAVAPKYPDTLYLIGSMDPGDTVVEQWVIREVATPTGQTQMSVSKSSVLTSPELTHIRACAADQSQSPSFLICQKHETGEVFKLSLPSGKWQALLSTSEYNLPYYDTIQWWKHVIKGNVFILSRQSNYYDGATPKYVLMWDSSSDGVPDNVESIDESTWVQRGYEEASSWIPMKTWFPNL